MAKSRSHKEQLVKAPSLDAYPTRKPGSLEGMIQKMLWPSSGTPALKKKKTPGVIK